jgi:tetratricopeptide (TPR) repeat protein
LQLQQQHGDRAGVGHTSFDLGTLYQAQERWADAEPALAQAAAVAREIGNRRGEANALGNLAVVCAALGQAEKADTYLRQAVAIAREIGDEALAKRLLDRRARGETPGR